uniref:Fanconi-associated nuclease n=1 Tax=Timema douglasi TaxID=61478 RepID=A0A7R8VFN3_TIMDO|nr:unnamed protein product [Timema douglasi]
MVIKIFKYSMDGSDDDVIIIDEKISYTLVSPSKIHEIKKQAIENFKETIRNSLIKNSYDDSHQHIKNTANVRYNGIGRSSASKDDIGLASNTSSVTSNYVVNELPPREKLNIGIVSNSVGNVNNSTSFHNIIKDLVPTIIVKSENKSDEYSINPNHDTLLSNSIIVDSENQSSVSVTTPEHRLFSSELKATSKEEPSPKNQLKLSYQLSQSPNKFVDLSEYMEGIPHFPQKKKRSPKKSPLKASPKRFLKNKFSSKCNFQNKREISKVLNFNEHPMPCTSKEEVGSPEKNNLKKNEPHYDQTMLDVYCTQFKTLLYDSIINFPHIFNLEEIKVIKSFCDHSTLSKKLYIRMFTRKFTWHRVSDIKYEEIGQDLSEVFHELEFRDYVSSDYSKEELNILFDMLKAAEVKTLCKDFHLQDSGGTKLKHVQILLKYVTSQRTLSGTSDSKTILRKRIAGMLGHCIKLCDIPREIFRRVLMVYTLPQQQITENDLYVQLLMMHAVQRGTTKFPEYSVLKTGHIFISRNEAVMFQKAYELRQSLQEAIVRKDWKVAQNITFTASEEFRLVLQDNAQTSRARELPFFLRRFTSGSIYAHALNEGIDTLKKDKGFLVECVTLLEMLIDQDIYLLHYRGFWYEKLALLLQHHLHNATQAADVIIKAMNDSHVNEVQKYTINSRGLKLHDLKKGGLNKSMKRKLYHNLNEVLDSPPNITIKAKSVPSYGAGLKRVYIEEDEVEHTTTYSSVEEFALSYYQKQGFIRGQHTEGSIIISLYATGSRSVKRTKTTDVQHDT